MHGTVTGFKSEIDNQDWIIAKAEHTIDNSGFTTQLELEAKNPGMDSGNRVSNLE